MYTETTKRKNIKPLFLEKMHIITIFYTSLIQPKNSDIKKYDIGENSLNIPI